MSSASKWVSLRDYMFLPKIRDLLKVNMAWHDIQSLINTESMDYVV